MDIAFSQLITALMFLCYSVDFYFRICTSLSAWLSLSVHFRPSLHQLFCQ